MHQLSKYYLRATASTVGWSLVYSLYIAQIIKYCRQLFFKHLWPKNGVLVPMCIFILIYINVLFYEWLTN